MSSSDQELVTDALDVEAQSTENSDSDWSGTASDNMGSLADFIVPDDADPADAPQTPDGQPLTSSDDSSPDEETSFKMERDPRRGRHRRRISALDRAVECSRALHNTIIGTSSTSRSARSRQPMQRCLRQCAKHMEEAILTFEAVVRSMRKLRSEMYLYSAIEEQYSDRIECCPRHPRASGSWHPSACRDDSRTSSGGLSEGECCAKTLNEPIQLRAVGNGTDCDRPSLRRSSGRRRSKRLLLNLNARPAAA